VRHFWSAWGLGFFRYSFLRFDTYYWSETHHVSGFGAIGYSLMLGAGAVAMLAMATPKDGAVLMAIPVYLLMGTIWLANIVMVVTPFCLARMERGKAKGGIVAGLLLFFFCEAIRLFLLVRRSGDPRFSSGSYVWAAAVGCAGVLFLMLRLTNGVPTRTLQPLRPSADT
jgi:hypothetical protein